MRYNTEPIDWENATWPERIGHVVMMLIGIVFLLHLVALPFIGIHAALTGNLLIGVATTIMGLLLWSIIALLQGM